MQLLLPKNEIQNLITGFFLFVGFNKLAIDLLCVGLSVFNFFLVAQSDVSELVGGTVSELVGGTLLSLSTSS